jgi:formyl-CoA transferase/CoA:oxalate CoA-transferase
MSVTGTVDSAPIRYPVPLADMTTGLYASFGIMAALRVRDQTGQGQLLDLSLLEAQSAYLTVVAGDYFATGKEPGPIGNTHPGIVPYQVFKTADKDVVIAAGSEKHWRQLCEVLGLGPEVRDDPRYGSNPQRLKHRAELVAILQARLAEMPSDELLPRLRVAEIPCGPINSVAEALADPQYVTRGNVVELEHPTAGVVRSLGNPVRLGDTPPEYRLPPPRLGEHTADVLRGLGYTEAELGELRQTGAV